MIYNIFNFLAIYTYTIYLCTLTTNQFIDVSKRKTQDLGQQFSKFSKYSNQLGYSWKYICLGPASCGSDAGDLGQGTGILISEHLPERFQYHWSWDYTLENSD